MDPPEALFAPANRIHYTKGEVTRVFAQQPISGSELPTEYLVPSSTSTSQPPTVTYAWRLNHNKLMAVAVNHFPAVVLRRFTPETDGLEADDSQDPADYEEERDNIADTLLNPDFRIAIQE